MNNTRVYIIGEKRFEVGADQKLVYTTEGYEVVPDNTPLKSIERDNRKEVVVSNTTTTTRDHPLNAYEYPCFSGDCGLLGFYSDR